MGVTYNGKEISKEEFLKIILKRKQQQDYIKKMSKTELGRQMLRQKGIKPIIEGEEKREWSLFFSFFIMVLTSGPYIIITDFN